MAVFDFLRRRPETTDVPERRPAPQALSSPGMAPARVAWSPRDSASLTRTGFAGNPVGFRAVKMIAEAASALPLVLQDTARRYEEHPALDLVSHPNAAQGRAELLEALYGQLC